MISRSRSLLCTNRSAMAGSFCLYEIGGSANLGTVWPLAWQVGRVPAGGRALFQWGEEESLAWAEPGRMTEGGIFFAVQTLPKPGIGGILVHLIAGSGTWSFSPPEPAPRALSDDEGAILVHCTASVPANSLAVGWCRGGVPVQAVQAQPNITLAVKRTRQLCIGFGNFKPGQMIDPSHIPTSHSLDAAELEMPLSITLNPDASWAISPTTGQDRWL